MTGKVIALILALFLAGAAVAAPHEGHGKGKDAGGKEQDAEFKPVRIDLADVELLDQDGRRVKFGSDVVGERVVVIDLIFTSCTQVCPILTSIVSQLQEPLGARIGKEVSLVSITVDPNTDIPQRLKEYASKFDARPGWSFLTGENRNVEQVLKGLGGYTPDFTQHPVMVLVGDGRSGKWTRFYGFPTPEQILEKVDGLLADRKGSAGHHGHGSAGKRDGASEAGPRPGRALRTDEAAQREYFTDLPLVTQDGKEVKFYTDVLKGKVVLLSFIFTNCDEACPLLMQSFHELQALLGDRVGKEVFLVSISVDPETDTPEALKEYGERFRAGPGWILLTGNKRNIDWILYKLGQYQEEIRNHSTMFLLGDVKNGRWRKIPGSLPPEAIAMTIDTLLQPRRLSARTEGD